MQCVASKQMDCITNGCICLFLVDPPEIIQHPQSQSVATGTDATFRVKATGDEIEFQWQKDETDMIYKESQFNFSRTKDTSMLCIQHVQKSDKGHYRCLIKNSIEKSGKPSKEADLSVGKLVLLFHDHEKVCLYCYTFIISFHSVDPANITKNPESQSVSTGTNTTFTVEATGDGLQFQWQKDGIDIDSSEPRFQCKSVGNASTLHIKDTKKSDKGHYRCLIKNPVEKRGVLSAEANISVCKFVILLWVLSPFHVTILFLIFNQLILLR